MQNKDKNIAEIDAVTDNLFSEYCNKYGMVVEKIQLNFINECLVMGIDIDAIHTILEQEDIIRNDLIKIYLNSNDRKWFEKAVSLFNFFKGSSYISRAKRYVEMIRNIVMLGQPFSLYEDYFSSCDNNNNVYVEIKELSRIKNSIEGSKYTNKKEVESLLKKIQLYIDNKDLYEQNRQLEINIDKNLNRYEETMEMAEDIEEVLRDFTQKHKLINDIALYEEEINSLQNQNSILENKIEAISIENEELHMRIQAQKTDTQQKDVRMTAITGSSYNYGNTDKNKKSIFKRKSNPSASLELIQLVRTKNYNSERIKKICSAMKSRVSINKLEEVVEMDLDDTAFSEVIDLLIENRKNK